MYLTFRKAEDFLPNLYISLSERSQFDPLGLVHSHLFQSAEFIGLTQDSGAFLLKQYQKETPSFSSENGPDITVSDVTVTASSFMEGEDTTIQYTISNIGDAAAYGVIQGIYISNDNIYDAGDALIDTSSAGNVAIGEVDTDEGEVLNALSNYTAGTYYLFVVADYANTTVESNENNNVSGPVEITITPAVAPDGPDLSVSALSLSSNSISTGTTATINFTVTNSGDVDAVTVRQGIYISTDNVFDGSDVLLDTDSAGTVTAGEVDSNESTLLDGLASYTQGIYYLFVVADYDNTVTESNEANNLSGPIQIEISGAPDVTASNVVLDEMTIYEGTSTTIRYTVSNIGNALAANSVQGIYISDDNVFDGSDTLIDSDPSGLLNIGEIDTNENEPLQDLANYDPGIYYLFVVADYDNGAVESNESNNVSAPVQLMIRTQYFTPGDDSVTLPIAGTYDALGGNDYVAGTSGIDTIDGGSGADFLQGLGGDDILIGGGGQDTLVGGAGNDSMSGGSGNDTYIVEDIGDTVTETSGSGFDVLYTYVDYTLPENLHTGVSMITGVAATLNGNARGNVLIMSSDVMGSSVSAGAGADTIYLKDNTAADAGSSADTITMGSGNTVSGGTGNDTYILNGTGNTLIELVGEGNDTVFSLLADTTLSANVEVLALVSFDVNAAMNATGNDLSNSLIGSVGSNILSGLGGNDFLVAGAGNDTLVGGAGLDTMQGNTGEDIFVYNAVSEAGDIIQDWVAAEDSFAMSAAAFGFVTGQTLVLGHNLVKSDAPIAVAATATFLWDSDDTALYYDADGSGTGGAVLVADLQAYTDVGVSDFTFF